MTSRPFPGRAADDNPAPLSVTELTIACFGPGLICALVASALLLVKVW